MRFFQHTPTTEDIEGLVVEIGLACERWLARQGFAGEAEDSAEEEDEAQGVLQLASLSGTVATGERAGKRVRRVVVLGGKEFALGPRCAGFGEAAAKRVRVNAPDAPPGWAELLRRVFGVDGWACPDCGKRMRLRTVGVGSPASTTLVPGLLR